MRALVKARPEPGLVPKGQARIRTQMNARLARDELDRALEAFRAAGRATGALA